MSYAGIEREWETSHGHCGNVVPHVQHAQQLGGYRRKICTGQLDRHGPCICSKGPDTDGPDEFCPYHGRLYDDVVEMGAHEIGRLRDVLTELVDLKDGPRDEDYERRKPEAWAQARRVLGRPEP
jgi:hypothetical protein